MLAGPPLRAKLVKVFLTSEVLSLRHATTNLVQSCTKSVYRPSIAFHRAGAWRTNITLASGVAQDMSPPPKPERQLAHFCRMCGGKIELQIPADEAEWRHVCNKCGYIDYFNPKMVVGCIVEHEGKILMCKRGTEPCKGRWTVPAGYMEMAESSAEGAIRETREEANCNVEVIAPYAHFDIPRIGQAYVLFRAKLLPPYTYGPSAESTETVLMSPEDIPFDEIAFSSVSIALQNYIAEMHEGGFKVHHGVIEKDAGSSPNDPASFRLRDHIAVAIR